MGDTGRALTLHGGPLRKRSEWFDKPFPEHVRVRLPLEKTPFTWLSETDKDVAKTAVYTLQPSGVDEPHTSYRYSRTVRSTVGDMQHDPLTVILQETEPESTIKGRGHPVDRMIVDELTGRTTRVRDGVVYLSDDNGGWARMGLSANDTTAHAEPEGV